MLVSPLLPQRPTADDEGSFAQRSRVLTGRSAAAQLRLPSKHFGHLPPLTLKHSTGRDSQHSVSHPVGRAGGRPLPCHRVSLVCVKRLLLLLLPLLLAKAIKKRTVRSGGGGGGGSQMVTQFSRNIRAKISTAARPNARSPPRPLTRCHRPKKRLLASAATAAAAAEAEVGSLGRRRRRRRPARAAGRRAGTPSMTICWLQAPIVNSH